MYCTALALYDSDPNDLIRARVRPNPLDRRAYPEDLRVVLRLDSSFTHHM